ncbi:PRD domain-containing protein [Paenibacillus sp. LMG 31459]|uniref:PRD domain-containing protein n=1 Tax=Paenibacillus phytohabitans TaxID=2654978 RepID=A0ABX1YP36_9BACL|nr:PRD domain-containing protein [Paenibacillus phytohabitans]NOU81861.1 PRD domain-containing protein [Paenibacillus phytohabitans]
MIIEKIFNNNAIIAKDSGKDELVVMGRGIGFKKNAGDPVDVSLIEKTFVLKQNDASEKFKALMADAPAEYVALSYDIIEYAKHSLKVRLSDYIYVTLTDHLTHALRLWDQGIRNTNPLIWEIQRCYPKEYGIAFQALQIIESYTRIRLPEDEAGNIALHLINAQINSSGHRIADVTRQTQQIDDILNIVKYSYNNEIDESSVSYERFITHLRYFFQRSRKKEAVESVDDFLLKLVRTKYKKAHSCVLKIEQYLDTRLLDEERLYLTIHIQRVTQRQTE